MTIQITVANAYGVAMASDRHVYRRGQVLSTGRQAKLHPLRTPVPAAMMAAGRFSILGLPVVRLGLLMERALVQAAGKGPDALAEGVLGVLSRPITEDQPGADTSGLDSQDSDVLARMAELVIEHARARDLSGGLEALLAEIASAPFCHNGEEMEAEGRLAWKTHARVLPGIITRPEFAGALREAPDLLAEAVVHALARDWNRPIEVSLMVGLCCPESGIPAVVAVNLWRGLGGRLVFAARQDRAYYTLGRAGRSLVISQGSGRGHIRTMIEGIAAEFADNRPAEATTAAVDARWQRAHDRIGIATPGELAAIAAGLARGAEVTGFLTGEDEGTVMEIDTVLLSPRGAVTHSLDGAAS